MRHKAPSFRGIGRASGASIAKIAVKVYVCHGCGLQYKGDRPSQCKNCGRLDFAKYDSIGEANHFAELRLQEMAGLISHLETQVRFPLMAPGPVGPVKVATYIADYVFIRDGKQVIRDFKGAITDVAALKLKWMAAMGLPVEVVTSKGKHHG